MLLSAWLIADALQPASYSPYRQTVSVMAGYAGTDRWIVTGALYLEGVFYLLIAIALTGLVAPARIGLAVAGLAAIGIAACPEPAHGSTAQHAVFTSIGALAIGFWPVTARHRASPSSTVLGARVTAAATAVSVALLGWTLIETRGGPALGLAERLSSTAQVSWPFVVALALWHQQRVRSAGSG